MGRRPKANLPVDLLEMLQQIGANLEYFRTLKGYTQTELGLKARVSTTTINEIESKRFRDIRLSTLAALAQALDISAHQMFQASDIKVKANDRARLLRASEDILRIARKMQRDD